MKKNCLNLFGLTKTEVTGQGSFKSTSLGVVAKANCPGYRLRKRRIHSEETNVPTLSATSMTSEVTLEPLRAQTQQSFS